MSALEIDINTSEVKAKLDAAVQRLGGKQARSLFTELQGVLEKETLSNFEAQGRPTWAPLSAAYKRERIKRNKGKSLLQILQDSGSLAASVHGYATDDGAGVGVGKAYAAIHQYGGTIERPAYSVKTRLRTDAKGTLLRQGAEGKGKNLAVFAKDSHKRARETWHEVAAYSVQIPSRPYLPFSGKPGSEVLQPEVERSLLDTLQRYLVDSFR